jgi:polyisoprenoid-binding protein YceI
MFHNTVLTRPPDWVHDHPMTYETLPRHAILVAAMLGVTIGCEQQSQAPEPAQAAEPQPATEQPGATADPAPAPDPEPAAGQPASVIPPEARGTYEIDPVHSTVVFAGGHFGVGWTYGTFNDVKGTFEIAEDLSESDVNVTVAANSIFTADKKRDDDLKGPDFLHTKQFPTMTFESTIVRQTDEGYEVEGDLTLRGQTKPVTMTMAHVGSGTVPMDNSYRTGFRGELAINRHEFGITAMPPVVGEQVELTVAIEGIRK